MNHTFTDEIVWDDDTEPHVVVPERGRNSLPKSVYVVHEGDLIEMGDRVADAGVWQGYYNDWFWMGVEGEATPIGHEGFAPR